MQLGSGHSSPSSSHTMAHSLQFDEQKQQDQGKQQNEEKHTATESVPQVSTEQVEGLQTSEWLSGWRLYGMTFTCQLCVFSANLEIAIVSTALVAITDSLQDFDLSSWIISSYLLTYTGFLIIWSKLSDSLGRRRCLCAAIIIFTIASGACGGAQTAEQLAFQGIGGSGLISLPFVLLPEMVQPKRYALWAAFTSCAFILGFLFGPLFGGSIVDNTTWRWVFLLNLPIGVATFALVFVFMPIGFPDLKTNSSSLHFDRLKEIDFVGSFLFFGSCVFIVSALEEAGSNHSWSSPTIVALICLSASFAILFPIWESVVERRLDVIQAVFTPRLMRHRVFMTALIITFFAGVNFTTTVIQVPQEWQILSNTSALTAGVRLLPFTLFYSIGTVLAMILTSKLHVPLVFVILMGAVLQTVATCLMSLIPVRNGVGKYLCECVLGIGIGEVLGVLVQMTPQLIRGKDQAAAMGAIMQFRVLGGVLGFAITTNLFNAYIKANLANILSPSQLDQLLHVGFESMASVSPSIRRMVVETCGRSFDLESTILIGFSVAQAAAVLLMWEQKLRRLI